MTDNNSNTPKKKKAKDKSSARGLGRGLDALFGDEEIQFIDDEKAVETSSVPRKVIGIEQLFPNPNQPRSQFDDDALEDLSKSIAEYGLLQPILVRPSTTKQGMFEIVAGERRWRASQLAQLHEVPVVIRDLDDVQTFKIALVENLQPRDLNPIEEGLGYKRLIDEYGYNPDDIGEIVGKSRSHVSNITRLLALPKSVQMMLEIGDITMGHARALLGAKDCEAMAISVIRDKLSVRETEDLVARRVGEIPKKNKNTRHHKIGFHPKDADTLALEKEVSTSLGMSVVIDMKDDSKGKMQINFKSLDQLDDILQRLAHTPRR